MIENSLARGSRTVIEEAGQSPSAGFEHVGEIVPRAVPVVEAIEREIARLKAARPRLSTRVERAEYIIATQLSTANGTVKPIKVRVHADGSRSYAVRSGAKLSQSSSRQNGGSGAAVDAEICCF